MSSSRSAQARMPARDASASMRTGGSRPRPLPHCCQTTRPRGLRPEAAPSVVTKVLKCFDGSPRERMALRVAWSAWVRTKGDEGLVAAVQPLDAPEAVAEPGRGQRRSLAHHADGASPESVSSMS